MIKPKVDSVKFYNITDFPGYDELFERDLKLTHGVGEFCLYEIDDVLEEISRHLNGSNVLTDLYTELDKLRDHSLINMNI